jgi:hypothetical protein
MELLAINGNLSSFINNIGWMCSFNQISSNVKEIMYEGYNPDAEMYNEIKIQTEHIY